MAEYRARPLGWDEVLTDEQTWDLDPYSGPKGWVKGELVTRMVAGRGWSYTQYRIGETTVDPKTLERVGSE